MDGGSVVLDYFINIFMGVLFIFLCIYISYCYKDLSNIKLVFYFFVFFKK